MGRSYERSCGFHGKGVYCLLVVLWYLSLIQWSPTEAPPLTFFIPVEAAALVLAKPSPNFLEYLAFLPPSPPPVSFSGLLSHCSAHEEPFLSIFYLLLNYFAKMSRECLLRERERERGERERGSLDESVRWRWSWVFFYICKKEKSSSGDAVSGANFLNLRNKNGYGLPLSRNGAVALPSESRVLEVCPFRRNRPTIIN